MKITNEKVALAKSIGLPSRWIKTLELKNEAGFPIEFTEHAFLKEFYDDLTPLQVLLKPPQIGATVAQILKTLWVAAYLKKDIIYTLPTASDVYDMAGGKINRIIAQNPSLVALVHDRDTIEQKQVGDHIIYYRGTFSAKQAMMVSSDLNVHDEVDASDPLVITQYETRLAAKTNGWRWYFSHPSQSGVGVDVFWQQSNKREWFVTCKCGKEQSILWPRNVKDGKYVCAFCGAEISDDQRRNGQWKATELGNTKFSGYHISQMMCPWIPATAIEEAFNDPRKDKQYFYNNVLGLPYSGGETKIQAEDVLKNVSSEFNEQEEPVFIGVDPGVPLHYVILNHKGVFNYGITKDYTQLKNLMNTRWPKAIMVIDSGGDSVGNREMVEQFPNRVFLCYYRRDRKTNELIRWDLKTKSVVVDRNRMIQLIVEQMRDGNRFRLNGRREEWKEFAEHFTNIYRENVIIHESKGKDDRTLYGNEFVWKRSGPDHFVHALLYALVARDGFPNTEARVLEPNELLEGIESGFIAHEGGDYLNELFTQ